VSALAAARPLPQPSELTAGFWAAARRRELVRPLCGGCGRSFFTPQVACPHCLCEDWTWARSSGRGVVYSATVVHRAPYPGFETPYELAMVDVEEGWTMLSDLVGTDGRPTPIGTPVRVDWLDLGAVVLPVFRPTGEAPRAVDPDERGAVAR
jgi:uncharacterized OB-fold protein